jgi:hypothetical protein
VDGKKIIASRDVAFHESVPCVSLLQLKYVFSQVRLHTGTLCAWGVVPLAGKYR